MSATPPIRSSRPTSAFFPACSSRWRPCRPDLQQHIRYPEDLFRVQAQLYRAYHMDTAEVFYNREDLWQFPRQAADNEGLGVPRDAHAWRLTT